MPIEIKNRFTGEIIEIINAEDLRFLQKPGANLSRANLRGADLSWANLSRADLRGAEGILAIGPIGKNGRIIYAVAHRETIMVQAGCFWDTLDAFEAAIQEEYAAGKVKDAYLATIPMIRTWYDSQELEEKKQNDN